MWRPSAMFSLVLVLLLVSCSKEEVASPCSQVDEDTTIQRSMEDGGIVITDEEDGISDDGNDDADKERNRKTRGN
jgi:hypothetical protein